MQRNAYTSRGRRLNRWRDPRHAATAVLSIALGCLILSPLRAGATPHVLVWSDGEPLTFLNPLLPRGSANDYLNIMTMGYLTRDDFGSLTPELAAEVPTQSNGGISADGKTVTFRLRPHLTWSDGQPLTSADVAFSVHVMNDPKTNLADRTGFELITKVETPNATTVVLHLSHRYGSIVRAIYSEDGTPLLPKHLLLGKDVNTADYMQLPVGAGPFRYRKWNRDDSVILDANPFYYRGAPKLKTIIYRSIANSNTMTVAIRTGSIDFWPLATKAESDIVRNDPSLKIITSHAAVPDVLYINSATIACKDPVVRTALRLALDRRSVVKHVFEGAASLDDSLVSQNDPQYLRLPVVAFDPRRARSMLDGSGWRVGPDGIRSKNGERLVLRIVAVSGIAEIGRLFEIIRSDFASVGVEADTRFYSPSTLFSLDPNQGILAFGKFDMAVLGAKPAPASELPTALPCTRGVPAPMSISRLCDGTYSVYAERYDATYDAVVAKRLAYAMQRRLNDLLPLIILAKRDDQAIMRQTISGYRPGGYSPFSSVFDMDVAR